MPVRRGGRRAPEVPSLPDEFGPAPVELDRSTYWDGVAADAALTLPDHVYDLAMTECAWRGVDARSRTFSGARWRDVLFEDCDLAGAVFDGAVLTRVRFLECRLTGAGFRGAQLDDVLIERGVADLVSFRLSVSSYLWVVATSLTEADFYDARLRQCALLDCDLTSADFDSVSLDGLSLHGSVLDTLGGAQALAGGGVGIDADQVVPLGAAVLAGMGVRVTERPPSTA